MYVGKIGMEEVMGLRGRCRLGYALIRSADSLRRAEQGQLCGDAAAAS